MADVSLTFPDGSRRVFPAGTTGRDVARSISEGLARNALAIRVGGDVRDLDRVIDAEEGADVAILTWNDDGGKVREKTRSMAHILVIEDEHELARLIATALQALTRGAHGFLLKPFSDEQLIASLEELMA